MFIVLGYTRGYEDPDDIDIHVETALADVNALTQWLESNSRPACIVKVDGDTAYTVKTPLNMGGNQGV